MTPHRGYKWKLKPNKSSTGLEGHNNQKPQIKYCVYSDKNGQIVSNGYVLSISGDKDTSGPKQSSLRTSQTPGRLWWWRRTSAWTAPSTAPRPRAVTVAYHSGTSNVSSESHCRTSLRRPAWIYEASWPLVFHPGPISQALENKNKLLPKSWKKMKINLLSSHSAYTGERWMETLHPWMSSPDAA